MIEVPANLGLRRRVTAGLALAALALAVVLALRSPDPGLAANETANIPVEASLDSCSKATKSDGRSCQIDVSFEAMAGAAAYETTITAPDGAVLLTAPAPSGSSSHTVPYVGNGTYGVRVTAYGPATR